MLTNIFILADSNPWGQLFGVAVVVVVWIVGLIAQAAKKSREKQQLPPELNEEIRRRLPPVGNRPSRDPSERRVNRPDWENIAAQQQRSQRKQPQKKQTRKPTAPPPVPVFATEPSVVEASPQTAFPVTPSTTARTKDDAHILSARALGRWLKPANLRQQFILTELLQRPLCDRNDQR